jgi:ABC-2 type transport system permease protein
MSAVTTTPAALPTLAPLPAPRGRAGMRGALRSEWTKLFSVRSTLWTLLLTVVVTIGISVALSAGNAANWQHVGPSERATFDPTQVSMGGLMFGQLVIVVLGALVITSEYSTGMIRASLTAMPRRAVVFWSKLLVFTGVTFVIGMVITLVSFLIGQSILAGSSQHIPHASLSDGKVLAAVIGGAVFLTGCGLLAFGLGAMFRHTAAAITAAIGLLMVLFIVRGLLPESWRDGFGSYVPFAAGSQIWATQHSAKGDLSYTSGLLVFLAYPVAAITCGIALLRKRDA